LDHRLPARIFVLILLPLLWAGCLFAAKDGQSQACKNKQKPQLQVRQICFEGNKIISSSELEKSSAQREKVSLVFQGTPA
jgi:hypothetical protein